MRVMITSPMEFVGVVCEIGKRISYGRDNKERGIVSAMPKGMKTAPNNGVHFGIVAPTVQ